MKFFIVLIAFAVILCNFVNGSPVEQDQQGQTIVRANRMRRVTCDLLSVSTKYGALNHSACAAHCLALRRGFRGGRCIDGVCNCRK